jgi:integrase
LPLPIISNQLILWGELWDYVSIVMAARQANQLTVKAIDAISEPGRYRDGDGLYLVADNKTAKRWLLRIMVQGRRRDLGLGSYPLVNLSEARELARLYLKAARAGDDPTVTLRRSSAIPDFETVARDYFTQHKARWKNAKHRQQWITTLEQYAFPVLGKRRIDDITTPDVVSVLSPIWFEKHETARRLKQRIATVFDDAKGKGHLAGENPVAGVSASLKRDKRMRPQHFAAMDYRDLPAFLARLRSDDTPAMAKLALEFTILTAARTGEVINARWEEIDIGKRLWTIPASRMKAGKEHRVPLSARALAIIETVRPVTEKGGWIFEGQRTSMPLSNMAMLKLLERMKVPVTVHGFRSTFRDWCGETTGFPHTAIEKCLAHEVSNKVEAAYARSDLLDRRREIMAAWESYLASKKGEGRSTVFSLVNRGR